jgi:Cdc6-like AAA superfamily ATPase
MRSIAKNQAMGQRFLPGMEHMHAGHMSTAKRATLIAKASEVFSPSAPINKRDLFAGRIRELQRVFDAVNTRGQHAVIFGERGVGKTSLANIVLEIAGTTEGAFSVKINCTAGDDFSGVWKKALEEVNVAIDDDQGTVGFRSTPVEDVQQAAILLSDTPSPNEIRRIARKLKRSIFIFDEFDRLDSGHGLFADTIKTLSDAAEDCTIVIVGVAHDIDALIAEHASIDRAVVQILMPRMTGQELEEIVTKAMEALEMGMEKDAQDLIVLLSQGLPHYTHVLGKSATIKALQQQRWNITLADVHASIKSAISDTHQKIRADYQTATTSPRKDTLFKQVLLACALAEVDHMGYFASADIRDPLTTIMGRRYEIPNFSQHLDKFCSDDRGKVLERIGTQRRFRFRFSNPLLQPFVIMRGIDDGMMTGDWSKLLQRP